MIFSQILIFILKKLNIICFNTKSCAFIEIKINFSMNLFKLFLKMRLDLYETIN
jgi:hypothetical protein